MGWCSIKEGDKKEFVRIEGDKVENTPSYSFVEGLLKGAGVVVTGGAYPLLTGALKAYSFYTDINNAATKDMQEKNEWTVTKTSLKGALLGVVKGTLHGVLDSMVIGWLTAGAVAVMGPFGVLLALVIGGVYNVVKDAIRT